MIKIVIVLLAVLALGGCTSSTEFGPCVGAFDDKDPQLKYKVSANNLVWGIVGFELVAPPVVVVINETFCPVGRRTGS